ncbi:MAG: porin family protein [Rhodobacteraceae bacterium]|nr:hypothetical protein [Alphaproteobacteria bacterium]MBT8475510.1 hypothetical protein [Alphaproteobacteria bacterium]NNF72163.1 porin family protein [Paracoccaceae bacterium]NNK66942.1 porin family protein [Paracoccaceae bacterium]
MANTLKSLTLGAAVVSGLVCATPLTAQDSESLFGIDAPSVTFGPYVRAELGFADTQTSDGFWDPPGASDPRILFDLDADSTRYGALAVGIDRMNGFRGEVALSVFGETDVSGPWVATIPATAGPHADMDGSVQSTTVMGNLYYAPLERMGRNAAFNPFVTVGLGFARNEVDAWSRTNPAASTAVRSFEGAASTEFAWSIGIGGTWQIDRRDARPILIDAGVRYFDLGDAQGGAQPLPGSGSSSPRTPLTFGVEATVVSVGVRIPLNR